MGLTGAVNALAGADDGTLGALLLPEYRERSRLLGGGLLSRRVRLLAASASSCDTKGRELTRAGVDCAAACLYGGGGGLDRRESRDSR